VECQVDQHLGWRPGSFRGTVGDIMTTRILIVVTNVGHYEVDPSQPTGLWLSELTHAYDVFERRRFEQTIVSPAGGRSPLEPRSLTFPSYDASARAWRTDPNRMALLEHTVGPDAIDPAGYDAIYFTGGHAVMFDFPGSEGCSGSPARSSNAAASSRRSATATAGCWT
jgi:hypothetical protein